MILHNEVITVSILAWFIAQFIKVVLVLIKEKKLNFRRFIETGGMPSSHSALVTALTITVAKIDGLQSTTFAISLVFALIVMYDASGVRRAAGKQAKALNRLIEEFYVEKPRVDERLKELLGHTPTEVFIGAVLGAFVALLYR